MKEERLRKMQNKRVEKKALKGQAIPAITNKSENETQNESLAIVKPNGSNHKVTTLGEAFDSQTPRLIFKDGKLVIDEGTLVPRDSNHKLTIVENKKPQKLTSMSFRPRNHTEKWTAEE